MVIFLFGDARQLHPFELVSPSEADLIQARGSRSRRGSTAKGDREKNGFRTHAIPLESVAARGRSDSMSTTNDDGSEKSNAVPVTGSPRVVDLGLPAEPSAHSQPSVIAPFLACPDVPFPRSPSNGRGSFEWVIASSSASTIERRSRAGETVRSVWAPMAECLSPVVRRGQWEIVIRSFVVGLAVALVVCGLCAAPYSGRRNS